MPNWCYVDVTKPLSTPPMPPLHLDTHPPPVSTLKLCQKDAMLTSLNRYLPLILPPCIHRHTPSSNFYPKIMPKRCYVNITKPLSTPYIATLHSQTHTLLQFLPWNYAKQMLYIYTYPLSTLPTATPALTDTHPPPVSTLKLCQTDAMLMSLNRYLPFLLPPLHSDTHPLQFLPWNYSKQMLCWCH